MKRTTSRWFGIAAASVLLCLGAASAWSQTKDATFSFENKFMLSMSGYVLPPGQYTLEDTGEGGLFRLHQKGREDPIAVIDTWNTLTPMKVAAEPGPATEAVLEVRDPANGQSIRSLEGFVIAGDYFDIRDVATIDRNALSRYVPSADRS